VDTVVDGLVIYKHGVRSLGPTATAAPPIAWKAVARLVQLRPRPAAASSVPVLAQKGKPARRVAGRLLRDGDLDRSGLAWTAAGSAECFI
jgi:hypothetical protein